MKKFKSLLHITLFVQLLSAVVVNASAGANNWGLNKANPSSTVTTSASTSGANNWGL